MHQALLRQLANAHLGTHKVQTRAEVNRTTKKLFKQKGTGNGARAAARPRIIAAAAWPLARPHSYEQDMPLQDAPRRGAQRAVAEGSDNQIIVVDSLIMERPRPKISSPR